MKLKLFFPVSVAVVLTFFLTLHQVEGTLMLSSLLMALKGGLMVGKMSVGGLMMMLLAASNQYGDGGSGYGATKRRLVKRHVDTVNGTTVQENVVDQTVPMSEAELILQEKEIQTRILRQISNLDPLMCLPKVMCGLSSAPPSTKTSVINDYAYLIKTLFAKEDKDELEGLLTPKDEKKKKTSSKGTIGLRKKKPSVDDDSDEESEEAIPQDDFEFERLALREKDEVNKMAEEELLEDEPGLLPFVIRDMEKRRKNHHNQGSTSDYGSSSYYYPPQRPQDMQPPPDMEAPTFDGSLEELLDGEGPTSAASSAASSLLSSLMPKISFGLRGSKPAKGDVFQKDPFFSGFKRDYQLQDEQKDDSSSSSTFPVESSQVMMDAVTRRVRRVAYLNRKKRQLESTTDPTIRFKIATEVGKKLKSPRQCRVLFNSCPFKYTEVLGMIDNLRKALQGHPEVSNADKVVQLKQKEHLVSAGSAPSSVINVNAVSSGTGTSLTTGSDAGTTGHSGITSISHQLPNGERVEINLKLFGSQSQPTAPAPTVTIGTKAPIIAEGKPVEDDELFDEDPAPSISIPSSTKLRVKSPLHSMESLESLKATILAIERINNATLNRKKNGQEVTYAGVFQEVTGITPTKVVQGAVETLSQKDNPRDGQEPENSSESPEDDEDDLNKPLSSVKLATTTERTKPSTTTTKGTTTKGSKPPKTSTSTSSTTTTLATTTKPSTPKPKRVTTIPVATRRPIAFTKIRTPQPAVEVPGSIEDDETEMNMPVIRPLKLNKTTTSGLKVKIVPPAHTNSDDPTPSKTEDEEASASEPEEDEEEYDDADVEEDEAEADNDDPDARVVIPVPIDGNMPPSATTSFLRRALMRSRGSGHGRELQMPIMSSATNEHLVIEKHPNHVYPNSGSVENVQPKPNVIFAANPYPRSVVSIMNPKVDTSLFIDTGSVGE